MASRFQKYVNNDGCCACRLVEERLDALDERISALDGHFAAEQARVEREVEERHHELLDTLEHFEVHCIRTWAFWFVLCVCVCYFIFFVSM